MRFGSGSSPTGTAVPATPTRNLLVRWYAEADPQGNDRGSARSGRRVKCASMRGLRICRHALAREGSALLAVCEGIAVACGFKLRVNKSE
jgi:hypothetical protein